MLISISLPVIIGGIAGFLGLVILAAGVVCVYMFYCKNIANENSESSSSDPPAQIEVSKGGGGSPTAAILVVYVGIYNLLRRIEDAGPSQKSDICVFQDPEKRACGEQRDQRMDSVVLEQERILETEMALTTVMGDGSAVVTLGSQFFTSS